jgi:hypothetical protein
VKGKIATRSAAVGRASLISRQIAASSGSPLSGRAATAASARSRSGATPSAGTRCVSRRRPSVIVPVLSEQMQVVRPMFSTVTARRTSAWRWANR